ncbi:hypothetical protein PVAP13_2NG451506 [Panicum virgatum]|uniref:Uncharacterized protein n=1 Tax=Panicum virgatum TaxID=38727 RepID=A0A8T0VNL3_PANVG|nr:hypothetical protein PVAP13_2NG451506 [Panicum virgatum]
MNPFWISISFHNPAFPSFLLPCNPGPPLFSTVADGPAAGTGRVHQCSLQFDGFISLSKQQRLSIVKVWAFESFMPWESSYAKGKWLLR